MGYSFEDIIMYLENINNYVNNSVLKEKQEELDLQEILMLLSSISEIIQDIEDYPYNLFYSKN